MNNIVITGNLGKDPKLEYTQNGLARYKCSVAVNEYKKDAQGQRQQETTWFAVTVWGKLAEVCNTYLHSGSKVLVEGSMKCNVWQDQQGGQHYNWFINAKNIEFLSTKAENQALDQGQIPSQPNGQFYQTQPQAQVQGQYQSQPLTQAQTQGQAAAPMAPIGQPPQGSEQQGAALDLDCLPF